MNAIYNVHFNFREAPFSLTPDPQFYYSNAAYREASATLRDGILTRQGFIVISGEAGTGKTTLLKKALQSFGSNITTVYVYNSLVDYTQLLRFILADLGLPNRDECSAMAECLEKYLVEQFKMENIVALLIDEAQDMSLQNLQQLTLLGDSEIDKKKLVQTVLVGQPELEEKLERMELVQLKQSVMVRCRLAPVGLDEVEPYIAARLHKVGHDSRDLFAREAIEKIALYSNGIPRLINNICDNALLIAYQQSQFQVSGMMVDQVAVDLNINRSDVKTETRNPTSELATRQDKACESSYTRKDALALDLKPFQVDSNSGSAGMNVQRMLSSGYKKLLQAPRGAFLVALLVALSGFAYSQKSRLSDLYSKGHIDALQPRPSDTQLALTATFLVLPPSRSNPDTSPEPDSNAATKSADLPSPQPARRVGDRLNHQRSRGAQKDQGSSDGNYLVAAASFVRNNPASNAAITATLEPGTRIRVTRYSGDYFRIRSLSDEPIHGYVHREDAFFEPIR